MWNDEIELGMWRDGYFPLIAEISGCVPLQALRAKHVKQVHMGDPIIIIALFPGL